MDFLSSIFDNTDDDYDFMKDSKKSKKTPEFLNSNIKNCNDNDSKPMKMPFIESQAEQSDSNNFFCFSKQDNQNNSNEITNNTSPNNSQILGDFDLFKNDSFVQNKTNFTNNLQNIPSFDKNNNQTNNKSKRKSSENNNNKINKINNTIIEKVEEEDDYNSMFSLNNFQVNFNNNLSQNKNIISKNYITNRKNKEKNNNIVEEKLLNLEQNLKEKLEENPKENTPKKEINITKFHSPLNKSSPLLNHSLNYSDIPRHKVTILQNNNIEKSPIKLEENNNINANNSNNNISLNNSTLSHNNNNYINNKTINDDYNKLLQIINLKKEKTKILKTLFPIFEQLFIVIENLKFEVPLFLENYLMQNANNYSYLNKLILVDDNEVDSLILLCQEKINNMKEKLNEYI